MEGRKESLTAVSPHAAELTGFTAEGAMSKGSKQTRALFQTTNPPETRRLQGIQDVLLKA